MANIIDALKGLVTPELISKAASFLGEDSNKVETGFGTIIPSLLGSVMAKGNNPAVESALSQAAGEHGGIMSSLGDLFSGAAQPSGGIGSTFLKAILGDKLSGFTSGIASHLGLGGETIGKLISMASPLVAGFLGNHIKTSGTGLSGLLSTLTSQKSSFLSMIPSGLSSVLGVSSLANLGDSLTSKVSNEAKAVVGKTTQEARKVVHEVEDVVKKNNWWWWIVALLALVLLSFFGWRSCANRAAAEAELAAKKAAEAAQVAAQKVEDAVKYVTLTDGTALKAVEGGIEQKIVNFLESDAYKNAKEADLKDTWFDLDKIDFAHGSATEFTAGSEAQLIDLITILKHYKTAKIKIGGYADKTGNAAANLKLSQERANTIKSYFVNAGAGDMIAGAEGYGDKFAKFPATATEEERATDRKFSIRFVK